MLNGNTARHNHYQASPPTRAIISDGGSTAELKIKGATLEELRSQRAILAKTEDIYKQGILDPFTWETVVQPKLKELDDAIAKAEAKIKPPKPTFADKHAAFLAAAKPHADIINQYLALIDQAVAKENEGKPESDWVMRVIEEGKLVFKPFARPRGRKSKTIPVALPGLTGEPTIEDHITIILREGPAEIDPDTRLPISGEDSLMRRSGGEESYEDREEPDPGLTAEEIEMAYRRETGLSDDKPFSVDLSSFLVIVPGSGGNHGKRARYVTPQHFEKFEDRYISALGRRD